MTLALGGCAHPPAPASVHAGAPQLERRLSKCDALIAASKLEEALGCARVAEQSGDHELARLASYTRATALLYRNDWYGSLEVLQGVMQRDHAAGNAEREALGRDMTTWMYWGMQSRAGGTGALDENEHMRQIVESATLADDVKRRVLLHYWWNRAYLMLDYALQHATDAEAARSAGDARKRYDALARQPDEHDRQAALATYFSVRCDGARRRYEEEGQPAQHDHQALLALYCSGDAKAARDLAATIDAKDDDVQVLFVLWLAFDAAGDVAAASAIRHRIDKSDECPMKPLVLQELSSIEWERHELPDRFDGKPWWQ